MSRRGSKATQTVDQLERLIRQSRVMDPALKRQWLQVLPFLSAPDRARLAEILQARPGTE